MGATERKVNQHPAEKAQQTFIIKMNKYLKYALIAKAIVSLAGASYLCYYHIKTQDSRISQLEAEVNLYRGQQIDLEQKIESLNNCYNARRICSR